MNQFPAAFDELGKRPMYALFNRLSGQFLMLIGRMGDELPAIDETHFVGHLVEIDPVTERISGSAESFEIVALAELPPVMDEYTINARCRDKIVKRYPEHRQLNLMADLLEALVAQTGLQGPAVEAFQQMRAFIAQCQTRNARYKVAYAQSPDFIYLDEAALEQRVLDELEGGLHEVIGGPLGTAVTPYS
ncbi:hypothetical protein NNO07_15055 [Pseudomonas resinovorans]|uniref:Uncharacterized protein n=1 Tax=Metapseudomonas resinovorans TaxID=53412 RepID=A0ABT4Y6A2_METRE|nr:hypothetical protein [Pseudomonas resinovorans]MDA8484392.1 hypothetical protein [Pseudomonas resinovorans]